MAELMVDLIPVIAGVLGVVAAYWVDPPRRNGH